MSTPNTLAVGQQIVVMIDALRNPDTTRVYSLVQLEAIKDLTDLIATGGVCCEVYGDVDTSDRKRYGGVIHDEQGWAILSICSLDTPVLAQQIYNARDALVVPFQTHAQLAGTPNNVFLDELDPNMQFTRIFRNGVWWRAHVAKITTKQQWQVTGGIQS